MNKNALAISPKASPQVRQLIVAADKILLSPSMSGVIKQMISGAQSLVKGAVPFLANLIMKLESKSGPLQNDDEAMLIFHVCGHFAEMAHELGDPDAKDTQKLTAALMSGIHNMMTSGKPDQPSPMGQLGAANAPQPQQQPPPQQGAM